jgi:hypothetical protein
MAARASPSSGESAGGDVSQWDRELATLDDPSLTFVGPMTVSVIATKPLVA